MMSVNVNAYALNLKLIMIEQLKKMRTDFEEISGQWNGDNPGSKEDRAHAANEGIEAIDKLLEIIEELDY